jgi:trehalose 6-phosphate synthase
MKLLLSLPSHRELVDSLFDYDVVGFQTQDWLDSFIHYVTHEMDATVDGLGHVTIGDRTIRAIACPIGIDAGNFAEAARSNIARATYERMIESANGRALIIGVDRLDYSKGLQERFLGYERFLSSHSSALSQVFLLQIAPPSRGEVQSYQEIRATLDALSGRINGAFADVDWVPIRYVNRGYGRDELAGMYRSAKIGLVTPLRDGMNLVAKEYVAAQDPDNPGVLILSHFAGAATQLDQAVLVNPYSAEELSDAIACALAMPLEERIERWRALMDNVQREDVMWWRRTFTDALATLPQAVAACTD